MKHATSLRLHMLPGLALIQADLDYQEADVDEKLQQYISASQGRSAKLDQAFVMDIKIGLVHLFTCLFKPHNAFLSNFRCDKCAHINRIVGLLELCLRSVFWT